MSGQKTQTIINRISLMLVFLIIASSVSIGYLFFKKGDPKIHNSIGVNEQINYQGRLLTNTGAVVPDGTYNVEFKIYQDGDGVLGGGDETIKWTETRTGGNKVLVKNGYFSVYLGAVTAFGSNVDWNQDTLWLSINIGGTGSPSWDGEMTPFTRFSSTPYALNSKALGGLTADNFVKLAQGVQADASTTNSSIFINKTGATSNILQFQKNAVDVFTVGNTGATLFRNSADSTTAFQVQKSNSDQVFNIDTSTTANLLTNGNFESNSTGWAAKGSSTISQITSQHYLGNGSLQVANTAAANDGAKYDYSLASQTTYTLIFYAKSSFLTTATSTINIGRTEDGSTDKDCATAQTINGGGWSKVSCTFTTGNVTGTNHIYIKQTDATSRTIYLDSVQLQTSTNLATNPDVEVDASGWGGYGAINLSQTTAQFYTGAGSLQADTSTSASLEGPTLTPTVQPNTTYTASFWVMLDAGTGSSKTFSLYKRFDTIDAGIGSVCASASLSPGTWTNMTCTFTTGSVTSGSPFIAVNTTDDGVTPITFYVDNASFSATKWNSNDSGRISLNGAIESPVTLRGQNTVGALQIQQQDGKNIFTADTLNGYVGIGTDAPTKNLQVDGKVLFKATNTDTDTVLVQNASGVTAFQVGANSRAVIVGNSTSTTNGSLTVYGTQLVQTKSTSGSATAFRVADSSNKSILTASTSTSNKLVYVGSGGIDAKFQIIDTSSTPLLDADTTSGGLLTLSFDQIFITNTSTFINGLWADGAGGLSINTGAIPAYILDVGGDANLSSGSVYRINGATICAIAGCAVDGTSGIKNQTSLQTNSNFYVQSAASGSVAGIVRGHASQTADIFQVKDGAGSNLLSVGNSNTLINATNSAKLQSWTSTSSLSTARRIPSVAYGKNGYIYVAGGYAGGYSATSEYAKIKSDGTLGSWTAGPSLNTGRQAAATVVANGFLYVIGGTNGSSLADVEYARINSDGTLGTWVVSPSNLNTPRERFSAVTVNGYIYVVAGSGGSDLSSVEYAKVNADGTLGTWTATTSLITARNSHAVFAANGYVYVTGGIGGSNLSSTEYAVVNADGTLGTWTATTSLNSARNSLTASVANGYAYAIGGNNGSVTGAVEYASFNSNGTLSSWTTDTNSLGVARDDLVSVVANGYIYAIAGYSGGFSNAVEYASTTRTKMGGTLDLVGLSNGDLSNGEAGGGGGLTAGDTNIIGGLQVQGQVNFAKGLNVGADITVGGTTISGIADLTIRSGGITPLNLLGEGGVYIDSSASGQIYIGTQGSIQDVNIGNPNTSSATRIWAGSSGILVQPGANTSTAFQIKDTGNVTLFGADTSNSRLVSGLADGASAVGFKFNTLNSFTTAGAKLLNLQNNNTEKFAVDKDGNVNIASGAVYQVNGTPGASTTCSGGQFLQNQVTLGGLTTSGTCATPTDTGVTIVGAFSGSSQPNGASISGNTITFGPADASNPGMVTNGTQTFAGNKTFNGDVEIFGNSINLGNNIADTILLQGEIGSASPLAFEGATNDNIRTIFAITDPTVSDKTITFANATGTVLLHSMISSDALVDSAGVLTIQNGVVSNAKLANSSLTVTAGNGLTTGGSVSLGSSVTLDIGAGNGITVNANDITLDLTVATDGLSSTTSSSSGLEVLASGLTLLQGCADGDVLKWVEGSDVWNCAVDAGGSVDLDGVYDADSDKELLIDSATGLIFDLTTTGDFVIQDSNTTFATFSNTGGITFAPTGSSDIVFTLDDDSNFIINDGITNTGSIFDINTSLGADADVDTVSALNIDVTSANTGDADNLMGINIGNLASADATVNEKALRIGTGWDQDLLLDDTTPNVQLGATDNTAIFDIVDSCSSSCVNGGTSPNSLLEVRDIATNFGGLVTSGGFFGTNSYTAEEFSADLSAASTADSAAVGDSGTWYADLSTAASTENWSQTDQIGGFVRLTTGTTSGRGVLLGFGAAQNNLSLGFSKANLPVMQMKVRTNINNATNDLFWGFMTQATAPTANDTKPAEGIYFWNNNAAGAWQGVVRSGGADVGTVTCSGSISTTQFAVGRIQVESATSVRFLIDNDVSDGVSLSDCGTVSGANPAGSLGIAAYTIHTETTGRTFDIDYVRVWQDDNPPLASTAQIPENTFDPQPQGIDNLSAESTTDVEGLSTSESDLVSLREDMPGIFVEDSSEIDTTKLAVEMLGKIKSHDNRISQLEQPTQQEQVSEEGADNSTDLNTISVQNATISLNLGVNGAIIAGGGLTVGGPATFNGEGIFNKLVTFVDRVIFRKDVTFAGRTTFNNDTGGFATMAPNQTEIRVNFVIPYETKPVVTVSIRNGQFVQYAYKDLDANGFTIVLSQPSAVPVEFSWTALSVDNARTVGAVSN